MQRILTVLFLACVSACFVTANAVANNTVNDDDLKSFNLNLGDHSNSVATCCDQPPLSLNEAEPNAGEEASDGLKVTPEFYYGKQDDDYNDRYDQYDTEVKLKVKVPVDINY